MKPPVFVERRIVVLGGPNKAVIGTVLIPTMSTHSVTGIEPMYLGYFRVIGLPSTTSLHTGRLRQIFRPNRKQHPSDISPELWMEFCLAVLFKSKSESSLPWYLGAKAKV